MSAVRFRPWAPSSKCGKTKEITQKQEVPKRFGAFFVVVYTIYIVRIGYKSAFCCVNCAKKCGKRAFCGGHCVKKCVKDLGQFWPLTHFPTVSDVPSAGPAVCKTSRQIFRGHRIFRSGCYRGSMRLARRCLPSARPRPLPVWRIKKNNTQEQPLCRDWATRF